MARGSFRPGRFRTKCDPDEWMIHTMSSSVSSSSWKASHASRAVLKLISLGCTSNISAVSHMRSRTRLYARMATAISRSRLSGVRRQAAEFAHTHRGFIRPDIDFHIPHPTSNRTVLRCLRPRSVVGGQCRHDRKRSIATSHSVANHAIQNSLWQRTPLLACESGFVKLRFQQFNDRFFDRITHDIIFFKFLVFFAKE